MSYFVLLLRSLDHHRRMHAAIVLCALIDCAALTGALLVGDSMRGSLQEQALRRLGPVEYALRSERFVRETVAREVGGCGLIVMNGAAEHAERRARARGVQILGVDASFWRLFDGTMNETGHASSPRSATGDERGVVLNAALAREIGAAIGDDVLLRLSRFATVPMESVLGRPDESAATLRLTVVDVIDDSGPGAFALPPMSADGLTAFVPLAAMQRATDRPGRVNAVVMTSPAGEPDRLSQRLAGAVQLSDYDLVLRADTARGYVSLESEGVLIEPAVEAAARSAARSLGSTPQEVLSYLANDITLERAGAAGGGGIPYSIVSAVDASLASDLLKQAGSSHTAIPPDGIILNEWAADDLGATMGDRVRLAYYVSANDGRLDEQTHEFEIIAISPMSGAAADPGFLPAYRGISDAESPADWDPPSRFAIDLKRIRDKDDAYWKSRRGTPKAFVALETGQRLWTEADSRFGRLTAVRISVQTDADIEAAATAFDAALRSALCPADMGLTFVPVRAAALDAGTGSTDFGMLFLSFSFFLVASSALLVGLVFRLNLERRAAEIGLFLALGFSIRRVRRLFVGEGILLGAIGSAVGLTCAGGYASLMLSGLGMWWSDAVTAPPLTLHVSNASLFIGFAASVAIAGLSIAFAVRGLVRHSPRALLAGVAAEDAPLRGRRGGAARGVFISSMVVASVMLAAPMLTESLSTVLAFFVAGAALLVGGLSGMAWLADRRSPNVIHRGGRGAMVRLGLRNAIRRRGRGLATAGLIACASFVVIAVGASRHDVDAASMARTGGTGGYSLMLEGGVPLPFDMGTPSGRELLGFSGEAVELLARSTAFSMRLSDGDDASCLNLYQVARPRIVGAPDGFIERGGFAFQRSIARSADEKSNPWTLLRRTLDDGATPVIGDANTLMWLLKLGLNDDFELIDGRGRPQRLRIVGMLAGSLLQSELVMSESHFKRLFPDVAGYGLVLIDAPHEQAGHLSELLERDLSRYGTDAASTVDRLNRYRAIENAYMLAFQMLGGIGVVLGTLGLAAVMLRNVLERRGEFALLQAVGYGARRMRWMVLSENGALLLAGLGIGGASALIAVTPTAFDRTARADWASLGVIILAVLIAGMSAGWAALRSAMRQPIVQSLRRE